MKRILPALFFLACSAANAQFVQGQILTAAQLNAAFANVLATSGGTLTGPLTVQGNTVVNNLTVNGTFTAPGALSPSSLAPQIPNSVIGNVSSNTQSPSVVGLPSCASNTNALIYTNGAGFTCNTNINASTLGGQIFAAPGPIGSSVASTGAFTTLSASSAISPSQTAGIVGTTTNNNANTGSVGEFVTTSTLATSASSGVLLNATSMSLTAGDWDVTGVIQTNPTGTTTQQFVAAGISVTSAAFGTIASGFNNIAGMITGTLAGVSVNMSAPVTRISIASTTTVYLVAQSNFGISTMTVSGFIRARRVR